MAHERMEEFVREEILPSWFTNRLQDRIGPLSSFRLRRVNATTIEAVAAVGDERSALDIEGRWRFAEAPVQRAVAGAAGTYAVFVVAKANDIRSDPKPFSDFTDYVFELRIVPDGQQPAYAAGVVDVRRRVGRVVWDGAAITQLVQEVACVGAAQLEDGTLVAGQVKATRQAGGGFLLDLVPGAVRNVDVAADAAIGESKLNLASDAAPGTPSRRTLGAGPQQAAAGNDPRLSDQRVPVDGSVTAAKIAGSLKPSGTAGVAAEALRALGTDADTAAAGNDARFPTANEKSALAGTSGAPGAANRYVTDADGRLSNQRVPPDGSVTNAKVAAAAAIDESKLNLASDAAAATASRRTLGPGATQAAPGNDARFPTATEKSALAGTSGAPGNANRYVTDADARLSNARTPTAHAASHAPGGSDALPWTTVHGSGTYAARPAAAAALAGYIYFATDTGGTFRCSGAAWVLIAQMAPLVTALPTTGLYDGREVTFQTAPMAALGLVWRLRYESGAPAPYRWLVVGGSALQSYTSAQFSTAATVRTVDGTNDKITVPLAGEYEFAVFASAFFSAGAGASSAFIDLAPTVAMSALGSFPANNFSGSISRTGFRAEIAGANTDVQMGYRVSSGTASFGGRTMTILPLRVG